MNLGCVRWRGVTTFRGYRPLWIIKATTVGTVPTWSEIGAEVGVSRATVARHVAELEKSGDYPDV